MMKELLKRYLSETSRSRIRLAESHVREAVHIVREGPPDLPPVRLASADFSNVVQAVRAAPPTDEVLRGFLEHVIANASWWPIFELPFFANDLLSEEFYAHGKAAALFGAGKIEAAFTVFKEQLKKNKRALTYHCASRCAAQLDDELTSKILIEGLQQHPNHLGLTLGLAACHFRRGDTAGANRVLAPVRESFAELTARGLNAPSFGPLKAEIESALAQKKVIRPEVGYSEAFAENYWLDLWFNISMLTPTQGLWSWLNHHYQTWVGQVLEHIAVDAQEILNFGVFCAEPDYRLALRFPKRQFFGIDREQMTKDLNDKAFQAPNLHFMKSEILSALSERAGTPATRLLLHGRTGCLFYPEFLRGLYRECARSGVKYICLHENISLSRTELKYYDFDNLPAESIPYMNTMLIHNYRTLLADAGYRITEMKFTPYKYLLDREEVLGDSHVFLTATLA